MYSLLWKSISFIAPLVNIRTLVGIVTAAVVSATQGAPGPGDVPPANIGLNTSGDEVLLTSFPGKVVIVTFWATWCPYCLKELPILEAVQNKAGKANMQVIAVNTEDAGVFRRASRILEKSLHLELVRDVTGDSQKAYGVSGIPHMVIIGRDGHILQVYQGYTEDRLDAIVDDINKALAQPAPAH